jgi:hypothetical protein
MLPDFPKINCPFIRKTFKIGKGVYKIHKSKYKLRAPEVYLVINQINPGYEWVFNDPNTIAVEKLDGFNVQIEISNNRIVAIRNRSNFIDISSLKIIGLDVQILEGIYSAARKGFIQSNGEQSGELIGIKAQGNPYNIEGHEWYPFKKAIESLKYKLFGVSDRTFNNISNWFQTSLESRYYYRYMSKKSNNNIDLKNMPFAEGVVFYNLKNKEQGTPYMAKIRRDMFVWYYEPDVPVIDYNPDCGPDNSINNEPD